MKKALAKVVIIGQPNVGKSTLFNRLAGTNQAIIADQAGTTRDLIRAQIKWQGKSFELIDSAGLNKSVDPLTQAAMALVDQAIDQADVIVMVIDGTVPLGEYDHQLARRIRQANKPAILVVNKSDQVKKLQLTESFSRLGLKTIRPVSAIQGTGSGDLLDSITQHLKDKTVAKPLPHIKVAILGRPNVGKSSLLNRLSGQSSALTSEVAGTTRDVNHSEVKYKGKLIEIADTAGLRRPGKIGRDIEYFSSLRTKKAIANSDVCLLLIDATEPTASQDQKIAGLAKEAGKGLILVVSKWDAVEDKDDKSMARLSRQIARDYQFVWWAPLIFTSAVTGLNASQLLEIIMSVSDNRQMSLPTTALNKIISQATSKQPPAGLKNKRPKIKYAVQKSTAPPHFILFASYPELIHFSYYRYIENQLREQYQFSGSPITIESKSKNKQSE